MKVLRHIKTFSVIAVLSVVRNAPGQQSLFQSASGDSTIYLPESAGVLSYNLGSDQARFDFNRDSFNPKSESGLWSFGGGVGGTIKKGTGNVINNNSPANGAFGEAGLSRRLPFRKSKQTREACIANSNNRNGGHSVQPGGSSAALCHVKDGQFVLAQFHYGYSEFYNLPSANLPVPSPSQIKFNQIRGTFALNLLRTTANADWRIGVSYVPQTANNLSDLKQQTYQSQVITASSSGQSVLSGSSKDVFVGAYKTYLGQQINADVVYQPSVFSSQVALDLLLRSDLGGGTGVRYGSPGAGIFFFTKGKPVVPVAGVIYTYRSGSSQVAISAGWSFGGVTSQ